jgi:glycosyltransferase involved in cell wall biosynthesis
VLFLGRVDNETLRREYASASLFVLVPKPQPGDVEGFGIVYLEAAGQGTPSLASRCGGAVDAVADGVSGFFANDSTPAGIADALRRFFTAQIALDEQAVCDHARRFAWPAVLRQVEHVYSRCLASQRTQVGSASSYKSAIPTT